MIKFRIYFCIKSSNSERLISKGWNVTDCLNKLETVLDIDGSSGILNCSEVKQKPTLAYTCFTSKFLMI